MYRILYVDDETGLLEIGRVFLEMSGQFRVDTTPSAAEALALLEAQPYDAVISDYQMPGMDGIVLLKKLRAAGNTIPFILFTGRGREEIVIQALNEGADFYLQKGGEPKSQFVELEHQTRQAIGKRRAESSIRDLEQREADIINFLPDATLVIDTNGVVIAWNRAMEEMTGVPAAAMLGKGEYAYAVPLYGKRQPILIDLIGESDEVIAETYAHITRKKDILIAETSLPRLKGAPATILGIASPLYDRQGRVAGAIESIRDVSDRKKAEDELRESQGRFAAFMDHLPVTAFIKDDASTNLYVNRRMVETFGEQDWIGKSVYAQFPEEVARKMVADDQLTLTEGSRTGTEYLVDKNGAHKIYETRKFRIDREGKPPLIGGFAVDITEQKRAGDALRESEEKYRSTIDALPDAVTVVDTKFTVILANNSMLSWMRSLGLSDDFIGKPFRDAFPFLPPAVLEEYRAVFATGTMQISEEAATIGSREIFTETRKIPLREHGEIGAVVAIITDITGRKQADAALSESEMRFRKIFENSPLGMALVTPDFRFSLVNPAWVAMTGYTEAELLQMSFADITHPDDRQHDRDHMRELARGTIPVYTTEKRYIRNDKSILWGLIRVTTIRDQKGTLRYFAAQIEDITERRRAAEALKESEERYRNVVEDQTEFISRFLPDGTHVFVNDAYCRYFGMTRSRILGHRFRPSVPAGDRERVRQFFVSLTPDHPVDTIEHRIIMPDGSIRWQRWSDRAIFDSSGTVREYQSVGQDITDRKREEEALQENELRLTSIYNTVGDVIFQLAVEPGGQFRFTSVNAAFSRVTGLSSDQVAGRLVSDVIPAPSLAMVLQNYRQAVETKEIVWWEETSDYPTGRLIGEVRVAPIAGRDGTVTHLIGSVHDITGRKAAEEALRASEQQFRDFFNSTGDAITIHDLQGRFLEVNDEICRRLGYSREEMLTMTPRDIDEPEYGRIVEKRIATVEKTGRIVFETVHRAKDGTRIPTEVSSRMVTYRGKPAILSTGRDITERRRTGEALQLANNQLGLLTAITRHDITNQLIVVRAWLDLLEENPSGGAAAGYFRKIAASLDQIAGMIQFTRHYESIGSHPPAWQECRALAGAARKPGDAGTVTVINDIPAGTEVYADPLICRVFDILMDNAIRHGGKITTVRFSAEDSADDPRIICEDDGDGVTAEEKEQIFKRGFGTNTGLGLFLAREILRITGITITETGIPGRGARFEIHVPAGAWRHSGTTA